MNKGIILASVFACVFLNSKVRADDPHPPLSATSVFYVYNYFDAAEKARLESACEASKAEWRRLIESEPELALKSSISVCMATIGVHKDVKSKTVTEGEAALIRRHAEPARQNAVTIMKYLYFAHKMACEKQGGTFKLKSDPSLVGNDLCVTKSDIACEEGRTARPLLNVALASLVNANTREYGVHAQAGASFSYLDHGQWFAPYTVEGINRESVICDMSGGGSSSGGGTGGSQGGGG